MRLRVGHPIGHAARRLRSRTTVGASAPWSSAPPSDLLRCWPYTVPVPAVRKRVLLDSSAAAPAKNTIDIGPRRGENAAGRDPPPPWGLRGTDIEPGEHDDAGLRVQLAAVFQ